MFKIRKSTVDSFKDGGYILYSNSKIAIVRKYGKAYKHNFNEVLEALKCFFVGIGNIFMSIILLIEYIVGFIPRIKFIDYKTDLRKQLENDVANREMEELFGNSDENK